MVTNNTYWPIFNGTATTSNFNSNFTPYTNTFRQLLPGEWVCVQCQQVFYIVDEQPRIVKKVDYTNITTYGSTSPQYLTQERIELFCSACN